MPVKATRGWPQHGAAMLLAMFWRFPGAMSAGPSACEAIYCTDESEKRDMKKWFSTRWVATGPYGRQSIFASPWDRPKPRDSVSLREIFNRMHWDLRAVSKKQSEELGGASVLGENFLSGGGLLRPNPDLGMRKLVLPLGEPLNDLGGAVKQQWAGTMGEFHALPASNSPPVYITSPLGERFF